MDFAKKAIMTTATVLVVVFVLNQLAVTRGVVQKALNG